MKREVCLGNHSKIYQLDLLKSFIKKQKENTNNSVGGVTQVYSF